MNRIVGLVLVGVSLTLGVGCAHDRPRPRATVAAVGNWDPKQAQRDPAHHRMGYVRVDDDTALNHTRTAWLHEDLYGQPNMSGPIPPRGAKGRFERAAIVPNWPDK